MQKFLDSGIGKGLADVGKQAAGSLVGGAGQLLNGGKFADVAKDVIGQNIKNVTSKGQDLAKGAIERSKLKPEAKEMLSDLSSKLISSVGKVITPPLPGQKPGMFSPALKPGQPAPPKKELGWWDRTKNAAGGLSSVLGAKPHIITEDDYTDPTWNEKDKKWDDGHFEWARADANDAKRGIDPNNKYDLGKMISSGVKIASMF